MKLGKQSILFILFCLALQLLPLSKMLAQGAVQTITFTGVVIDGDSSKGIRHANLYVARAGRGTVTNEQGFFSMPARAGDTVVITRLGYEKKMLIIPQRSEAAYSVVIDLKIKARMLPVVEIHPYGDEKVFKEVFLALRLPEKRYESIAKNLNKQSMAIMARSMPMDGNMNYKFYMQQQIQTLTNVNSMQTIPLLNPFAWAEFIKSIKRGDLKRKDD
jgi:hypothetical protein